MRKPRRRAAAGAAVLLVFAVASGASADDRDFYVQLSGGASFFENVSVDTLGQTAKSVFDAGFNAGTALGYRFSMFRAEAAADYRQADVSKFEALGISASGGSGEAGLVTLMANLYFDLPLGLPVTPYVGGGVGLGVVIVNASDLTDAVLVDDHGFTFAYNAMGGVAVTVTETFEVFLGYRYVGTTKVKLSGAIEGIGQAANFKTEVENHEVLLGVRVNF